MGKMLTKMWRYPLHKLGAFCSKGGIDLHAWGVVINVTDDSGLMIGWVRRSIRDGGLADEIRARRPSDRHEEGGDGS